MTDSEKLDLLLEQVAGLGQETAGLNQKFTSLDQRVTGLDQKVTKLGKDMVEVKADLKQLHRTDAMILDEVERVHTILDKHKSNKSVHTA